MVKSQNAIAVEAARATIHNAIKRLGNLLAVARILEIPRGSLASFLVGASREGTDVLVLSRVDRLSAPTAPKTGTHG